jgi:hypothetical protein
VPRVALKPPAAPRVPELPAAASIAGDQLVDEDRLEAVALIGHPGEVARARGLTLEGGQLRGNFAGAQLPALHLMDVAVDAADLANADLRGAALHRCAIRGARLTGTSFLEGSLRDASLDGCRADLALFARAGLLRVVIRDCDLRDVSFEEARMRDVRFERCDLSGASFSRASLNAVQLVGCTLDRVRSIADLRGASMPLPDIVACAGMLAGALGIEVLEDPA